MWEHGVSKTYKGITKEKIWEIWTDVNNWAKWHDDLDYCKIEGKFEVGNHFKLKPTGAPAVKIHLIEINEGNSFTDCTNFFGAKMYDTHSMKETKDGLEISNKVMVTGPVKMALDKTCSTKCCKYFRGTFGCNCQISQGI
jgi:hypothetical protein